MREAADTPAHRDDCADDKDFLVRAERGHSSADDGADASGSGLASRVEDQGHGGGLTLIRAVRAVWLALC